MAQKLPGMAYYIKVYHQLTKLNGHVHTKIFLVSEWPNLGYTDVRLNFTCMHPAGSALRLSPCEYYNLCSFAAHPKKLISHKNWSILVSRADGVVHFMQTARVESKRINNDTFIGSIHSFKYFFCWLFLFWQWTQNSNAFMQCRFFSQYFRGEK